MEDSENDTGMFVRIPLSVLRRTDISPAAKLIYARLSLYAGQSSEGYYTNKALSQEAGIKERKAMSCVHELVRAGMICVFKNVGKPNRFTFSAPLQESTPLQKIVPLQKSAPLQNFVETPTEIGTQKEDKYMNTIQKEIYKEKGTEIQEQAIKKKKRFLPVEKWDERCMAVSEI